MAANMPQEPSREVFISHGTDHDAATFVDSVLIPKLKKEGVEVFGYWSSLKDGRELVLKAAAESAVLVVILSPSYTENFWCMRELDVALNGPDVALNGPSTRDFKPRIISVLLEGRIHPEEVGKFWASQLPGLGPERQKLVDVKRWAKNIERLGSTSFAQPGGSQVGKDWWLQLSRRVAAAALQHLPAPIGALPGLNEQARILAERLRRGDRAGLWLHGPDGSGRSTLALLLSELLPEKFHKHIYVEMQKGGGNHSMQLALKQLAGGLEGCLEHSGARHVLQEHMQKGGVLYVLDNVCEPDELNALLPPGPWPDTTFVIITSSELGMPGSNMWRQAHNRLYTWMLQPLHYTDAFELLCHKANVAKIPEGLEDIVYGIVAACKGVPGLLSSVGTSLKGRFDKAAAENILEDLRGRSEVFMDDEQLSSKTAAGWYLDKLQMYGDKVSWDVFWGQLKDSIKETSLDGARWRYMVHQLHQDKQRRHFQDVVSTTSDSLDTLVAKDFLLFTKLTECGTLAEVIQLAMTSSLSSWQGGSDSERHCINSRLEQARAGSYIGQWSVRMDAQQRIVSLQGCATKERQRAAAEWLGAAPRQEEFWQEIDAPAQPCSSGFAELYGTKELFGLTSFMGAPETASSGTTWCIQGSKLSLQNPRAVGYQVRLSPDGRVNAARFMFRSFAPPVSGDTIYDAVFISHTNADKDAGTFAGHLHSQLNKAGIACFLDAKSLRGGMEWRKTVAAWARRCRVFVAIVSPSYPKRPWPLAELHLALRERKAGTAGNDPKTIPVLYDVHSQDVESVGKPNATELAQQWAVAWQELKPVRLGNGCELQLTEVALAKLMREAFESQRVDQGEVGGRKTKDADLAAKVQELVREYIKEYIT